MKNLISIIIVVLLFYFFPGCNPDSGENENEHVTVKNWGSSGSGDGQFDTPRGIALDSEGNVYVSDGGNLRIQKFTKNGKFLTKWEISNGGVPWGLVVYQKIVYVCVIAPSKPLVNSYDLNGIFIASWNVPDVNDRSGAPAPVDIDCDGMGNFYVLDNINRAVIKFNNLGNVIRNFRIDRNDVKQWGPLGIVVYGEYAYVTDSLNHRVDKWRISDGKFILSWGGNGSTDGKFHIPTGISLVGTEYILVGDYNIYPIFNRIQKFDLEGNFSGKINSEVGHYYPISIAVNNVEGKIYVCDQGDRIVVEDVF